MTRPGIKNQSPGPLVNTLLIRPMARYLFSMKYRHSNILKEMKIILKIIHLENQYLIKKQESFVNISMIIHIIFGIVICIAYL